MLVFATISSLSAVAARATCNPLSEPSLRSIDDLIDSDPERAAAAAEGRLSDPQVVGSPLLRLELNLLLAEARGGEGQAERAAAALSTVNRLYVQLPAEEQTLEIKVNILGAAQATALARTDFERVRQHADQLYPLTPPDSITRTCLMLLRGDVNAELDRPDAAVTDHLAAYLSAKRFGWERVVMESAFRLATTYRRSGLYDDARRMAKEATGLARAHAQQRLVWLGEITSGQIALNERKWDEALAELTRARAVALGIGDQASADVSMVSICHALVGSGRFDEADKTCSAEIPTLTRLGRIDLATDLLAYQSRINLARHHYTEALAQLDTILVQRIDYEPLRNLVELYQDRAAAYEGLGRLAEAVADLHRSRDAAARAALTERQLAAAVFSGTIQARTVIESNQALQRELLFQRQQAAGQLLVRRLAFGLAGAAIAGLLLLLYLLSLSRRHRRALQRQAALLNSLTHNLTDTVILIDVTQHILYANRPPLGQESYPQGCELRAALPEEARPPFLQAISEVLNTHQPLIFEVSCAEGAERRHYEQQLTPVLDRGRPIGVTIRSTDVTELRRSERLYTEARQRSAAQLSGNLEQGLAQELAGIALLLHAAYVNGTPDQLAQIGPHLAAAIKTTCELARVLSPMQAARGSLDAALRQLARESLTRLGVPVTLSINLKNQEPDAVSAEQICRTAEEALIYLAHTAHNSAIKLCVEVEHAELRLELAANASDGHVTPPDLECAELRIIRYRAHLLGGSCDVKSQGVTGLTVAFRVPLP